MSTADVESAARSLDRELRRLRIRRADRTAIVGEVRQDLLAAAADGAAPGTLIADVPAFARDAVAARGCVPRSRDPWSGAATALIGGAGALVVGYLLFVELLTPLFSSWVDLDGRYPVAGPALVYGGLALTGLGGALAAFGRLMAGRPAARAAVLRAAVLLPAGAAVGLAAAIAFGRSHGYATSPAVVVTEILIVAVPCAAGAWLARWWALRSTGRESVRPA